MTAARCLGADRQANRADAGLFGLLPGRHGAFDPVPDRDRAALAYRPLLAVLSEGREGFPAGVEQVHRLPAVAAVCTYELGAEDGELGEEGGHPLFEYRG